jgi:serine/threonine protein phosphatase PrpC
VQTAYATESGAATLNEDACQVWESGGLFAVCDGLSVGKGGGDVASNAALRALGDWIGGQGELLAKARSLNSKLLRETVQSRLHAALQTASHAVFQSAHSDPRLQSTCTTVDALLLLGAHALIAHVGSGRVYLARRGQLHQLTEDHTMLAQMRKQGKAGEISPEQKAAYAKRLVRAVGFREEVQADVFAVELEAGDRFFLVSDGIWGAIEEAELEKLLLVSAPPAQALKALHDRVGPGRAKDNFTTLVVDPGLSAPAENAATAEAKIKMLGTVPAFSFLSYQELIRVTNVGELVKLPAGNRIWQEGDGGDEMMLVLSGSVEITKNGKRLSVLGKGEVLGEMAMIDAAPRSATATTSAATNLLAFPREALFALLREEKELAVKFLWGVTMEMNKRLRAVSSQLAGEAAPSPAPGSGIVPFHREAP